MDNPGALRLDPALRVKLSRYSSAELVAWVQAVWSDAGAEERDANEWALAAQATRLRLTESEGLAPPGALWQLQSGELLWTSEDGRTIAAQPLCN